MRVKELIQELSKLDPELYVYYPNEGTTSGLDWTVDSVSIQKREVHINNADVEIEIVLLQ